VRRRLQVAISTTDAIGKETMVTLRDGHAIPTFGLGTYLSEKGEVGAAVKTAITDEGYILIDTARMYDNEAEIGTAIAELGIPREKFFVVTKLLPDHHGFDATVAAAKDSLEKLKLDYVDLFLIHNPKGKNCIDTWKGMLEVKKQGLSKAVGVSNMGVNHLKGLVAAGLEVPELNQVELHPWLPQTELVAYHKANGIATMGYCPLARCKRFGETLIKDVAAKIGKSEAQVAIRWSLQMGYITIPKSVSAGRIKQNGDACGEWSLSDEHMAAIAGMGENFKASGSVLDQDLPWADVQ